MFDIPALVPPTEEEMVAVAKANLAVSSPVHIENWPPALATLSIPTDLFPLDAAETDALIEAWMISWGGAEASMPADRLEAALEALADRLHSAVERRGRAFVRLGSRSPKDADRMLEGVTHVTSGREAVELLVTSMERVYTDLSDARRAGHVPHIAIRDHLDWLRPEREFRAFIEDGAVAGITQYHLEDGPLVWITENAAAIEAAARAFLETRVIPAAHIASFTADLVFEAADRPLLLEINPAVTLGRTFPGLFRRGPLDGSFRFLT